MRHGNAPDQPLLRRRLLGALGSLLLLPGLGLIPRLAWAADKKERKVDPNKPVEKPLVNTTLLVIEAVTAPVAGTPLGMVIMTFTLDCGTIENAQQVFDLLPRAYNAMILELNREPLGNNGRISEQDIDAMKRRLLFQVNKALRGPTVNAVLVRSLQEVPRRS